MESPWQATVVGIHDDGHPHWVVDYGCYAVTLRCAGALPGEVIARMREIARALEVVDPASPQAEQFRRRHFSILEETLDSGEGDCPLRGPVAEACTRFVENYAEDGLSFAAWVVMPNHLHLLTQPLRVTDTDALMTVWRRFKSRGARQMNAMLNSHGRFWQRSFYDRWIRDRAEYERWVRYLERNPVRAGLAPSADAYPYFGTRDLAD